METSPLNSQINEGIDLNEEIKDYMLETSKWAKFLSILGFIGIGIFALIGLYTLSGNSYMGNSYGYDRSEDYYRYYNYGRPPQTSGINLFSFLIYIGVCILYFFPIYYLFQFSTKIRNAIDFNSQESLVDGFRYLKSHYKYIGIVTIVILSLYVLIFIFAILAAISRH